MHAYIKIIKKDQKYNRQ